jgi:hypothetical protein
VKQEKAKSVISYRRILGFSFLLYIALIIPVSLFHELGHAIVCSAEGYSSQTWLDFRGAHLLCFGPTEKSALFNSIGGIFGLIASAVIIGLWLIIHKFIPLLVVGLAYSVDQSAKIILEGFAFSLYASEKIDFQITLLQIISLVVTALFVTFLNRRGSGKRL